MSQAAAEFSSTQNGGTSRSATAWSVETFANFWANPTASADRVPTIFAPDIVGYWPGRELRGASTYWKYIVALLEFIPDFRVRVLEHASNGEFTFIHWEATGTGPDGPFLCTGCDRFHVRNGIVLENRIFCEHPIFRVLAGRG